MKGAEAYVNDQWNTCGLAELPQGAEAQRISLSLKALQAAPIKPGKEQIADEDMPLPPGAPKPPQKRHNRQIEKRRSRPFREEAAGHTQQG